MGPRQYNPSMSWTWLDALGRLDMLKILFGAGMVGGVLMAVGAAMNARKNKDAAMRKQMWVLCGIGLSAGLASGLTAWRVVPGAWGYLVWLPNWVGIAWMVLNWKR